MQTIRNVLSGILKKITIYISFLIFYIYIYIYICILFEIFTHSFVFIFPPSHFIIFCDLLKIFLTRTSPFSVTKITKTSLSLSTLKRPAVLPKRDQLYYLQQVCALHHFSNSHDTRQFILMNVSECDG